MVTAGRLYFRRVWLGNRLAAAANEVHQFNAVALGDVRLRPRGAWNDLSIALQRNAVRAKPEKADQFGYGRLFS